MKLKFRATPKKPKKKLISKRLPLLSPSKSACWCFHFFAALPLSSIDASRIGSWSCFFSTLLAVVSIQCVGCSIILHHLLRSLFPQALKSAMATSSNSSPPSPPSPSYPPPGAVVTFWLEMEPSLRAPFSLFSSSILLHFFWSWDLAQLSIPAVERWFVSLRSSQRLGMRSAPSPLFDEISCISERSCYSTLLNEKVLNVSLNPVS